MMMTVFKLALFLTGITWSTGAVFFTQKPKDNIYFEKGSDAVLEWNYSDTTGELNLIIWRVYNKTDGQLKPIFIVNQTGDEQPSQNIPPAYVGRVEKKGRASLVIKNVNFEDSTDFTCSLQTKIAVAGTDTATLVVTGPSSIHPQVQFSKVGGSSTLTCNAIGVPSQNFTWMRQGETGKINNDSSHAITCSGTGSCELAIKNISVGDQGYYACDATVNPKQINSVKGYLQVQYPPKEDNKSCPMRSYYVKIGDQQTICCPVSGYPPPIVTWEKNGTQLQKGVSKMLNITNVTKKGFGNYLCTATDDKTSTEPFVISVMEKRELPVQSTDGTGSKAAKLEWEPQIGAKYYVVNITSFDDDDNNAILSDVVIGTQTSLEVHYHTLVMKKAIKKPDEIPVCAKVFAMNDAEKGEPPCQKLTIKKPSDAEN